MRQKDKAQLKGILTSDLSSDAMVIWTYLRHALPGGGGQPHFDKVFGPTDINWREGLDILLEMELVAPVELKHGGMVYKAAAPDVSPKGTLSSSPVPTMAAQCQILFELYQLWRGDNGFRPWTPTPADERKWESLYAWLKHHKVDFKEYADYALALYSPIAAVHVPGPSHLAGPYAQSNWLNRDSAGPAVASTVKRKSHAGSEYRPAKAIKRRLKDAGMDTSDMDASRCRYVDDLAQALVMDPDTPVPARWQEAVTILVGDADASPA